MKSNQPIVRSAVARNAWDQSGAGPHGGSSKQQDKRDRRETKAYLRRECALDRTQDER